MAKRVAVEGPLLLDTNILISGLLWRGNEDRLLRLGLTGQVKAVTCEYILQEVEEVLQRHGYTAVKARQTRIMLASAFKIIPDRKSVV